MSFDFRRVAESVIDADTVALRRVAQHTGVLGALNTFAAADRVPVDADEDRHNIQGARAILLEVSGDDNGGAAHDADIRLWLRSGTSGKWHYIDETTFTSTKTFSLHELGGVFDQVQPQVIVKADALNIIDIHVRKISY